MKKQTIGTILFFIAGMCFFIAAIVSGNIAVYLPIGSAFVCLGAVAAGVKKPEDNKNPQQKSDQPK